MSKILDTVDVSSYLYIMSKNTVTSDEPVGLSFQEKSLWVTLVSTLVVYAYYFWRALSIGDGDSGRVGALFVTVVIALIVVQVAAHVAIAVHARPEGKDERDRRVELLGVRNSYYVLVAGAWFALGVASMSLGTFWFAHAMLLALVVAEVVKAGSQLVYYRRGV